MSQENARDRTIANIVRVTGQLIWVGSKRLSQQLSPYGLTAPQYFALFSLWRHREACSMNVLAETTHQDAATMTGIIDRLVKLGYVHRQRGSDDRRKVYVSLSDAGQRVVEQIGQAKLRDWQRSCDNFSQADLTDLLRLLQEILETWK
jgi:DNA-binding MarR family transcriptional regulator